MARFRTVAAAVVVLILAVVLVAPRLSAVGGTSWQFDYILSSVTVNGVVVGGDDLPGDQGDSNAAGTRSLPVVDFFGLDVVMADAYSIVYDVDGPPRYTGAAWLGLLPTVSVSMSLPQRVDSAGTKIAMNAVDPLQASHLLADGRTVYEYYYQFTVHCETQAATFLVPPTLQSGFKAWSSAECGDFDVTASITVILRDSIFGSWEGEFGDAQVWDWAIIDLSPLTNPWLTFAIEPKVEPGAKYTAVAIQDRVAAPDKYTCRLEVPFSLSSGLTKDGQNNLPYDVWITKTLQTTLLLTEPLDIGATGHAQEGGQPFGFTAPFDWRMVLMVIFVAAVALAALYIVLNRKRGGKTE